MTSTKFLNYLQTVTESTSVTVESRLKNKSNLKPYWNNLIANISKNLWLPKKLNSENMNINSWFSVKLWNDKNQKSLEKIIHQSVIHSEECIIKQRSKKIRFYPTTEQKAILKQWFGVCRYFYNKTLHDLNYKDHDVCYESSMHQAYVEPKYPTTNYIDEARRIFAKAPDWAKDVPYQSKRLAIKQCCDAVKNAKIKYKKLKQIQKVKFKSKRTTLAEKNTKESIYIPKGAISALGIYHTKLGQLKFAEKVESAKYDCRLLIENGQYFLVMPYDKVIPKLENQKLGIVALDCGVRTFQTFYNPELAGKFGANDFNRIYRLCYAMEHSA